MDIFFWWTIVSTILGIGLLSWDIFLWATSRKEKEIQLKEKELHKAQVKIWQHFASGINNSLLLSTEAIREGKLSKLTAEDFGELIRSIQVNAYALFVSLNEERLFTEEEIKARQLEQEETLKKLWDNKAG